MISDVSHALGNAAPRRRGRTLARETFQTSRLLEYFSEKELTLQTGHGPERWADVIVKELIDNALDACEDAGTLPDITVTITEDAIVVADNGPGMPEPAITGMLDYTVRCSSKDAYVSPTRGAQGNALKTVLAIPYVLSGCAQGEMRIVTGGETHQIRVRVDRIVQEPTIEHVVSNGLVTTGTRIEARWPDLASSLPEDEDARFLQIVKHYALFNPHATFSLRIGTDDPHVFARTATTCSKWVASEPTSPHWYTPEQLRALVAAYITAERHGVRPRTVRELIAEFRGLSGTAKQKAILAQIPTLARAHLRDLVVDGDVDHAMIAALLEAMQAESRPVKPAALGVLGEAHLTAWLHQGGADTVTYQKTADVDEETGLPFVVEIAFGVRLDGGDRRLVTGINWAPTLVNPFRELNTYGVGLDELLGRLHIRDCDPVTFIVHLACPHLRYTDRGKSSLEAL